MTAKGIPIFMSVLRFSSVVFISQYNVPSGCLVKEPDGHADEDIPEICVAILVD
jgi:hypothetical protein